MSDVAATSMVDTKIMNLLLICQSWYQFIVWPCTNGVHFGFSAILNILIAMMTHGKPNKRKIYLLNSMLLQQFHTWFRFLWPLNQITDFWIWRIFFKFVISILKKKCYNTEYIFQVPLERLNLQLILCLLKSLISSYFPWYILWTIFTTLSWYSIIVNIYKHFFLTI